MFIPIGTDRPLKRRTVVTHALIFVTVVAFVVQVILSLRGESFTDHPFLQAMALSRKGFQPWQLFTYALLHGGFMHIVFNLLTLLVFGPNVEDRLGKIGFLALYLAGSAAAGIAHTSISPSGVIGASGAIAAVTGAYLVFFPHTLIKIFSLLFFIGVFQIPAWWLLGARITMDVLGLASGTGGNIAVGAHLGGYALGAFASVLLLWMKIIPREQYDMFTIGRQAKRRADIRGATRGRTPIDRVTADAARREKKAKPAPGQLDSAQAQAASVKRAQVSELVLGGRLDEAADAYRALLREHGVSKQACTLPRRHQYDLAAHLYQSGDHQTAAYAYERFVEAYSSDRELPEILLLLGRINARHLNDPVRARQLLERAVEMAGEERAVGALAKSELAELA